jgi:hypothetical protein
MYRTYLYCSRDLGANEMIETLPIGRRLAFDAAQGRLWVVCRGCEKWNLVPFDTRLESIETCERFFRDTRLRYSTDNIGIARLSEGLELVRIGSAERPEFAAWRYGDQFGRRRRNTVIVASGAAIALGGIWALGYSTMGIQFGLFGGLLTQIPTVIAGRQAWGRVATHLPVGDGTRIGVTPGEALISKLKYSPDGQLELEVPMVRLSLSARWQLRRNYVSPSHTFAGERLPEALQYLMPLVNRQGGSSRTVQSAAGLVSSAPLNDLMVTGGFGNWKPGKDGKSLQLATMKVPHRLAVEMMLHEDRERAAMAGELKLLERQWREAEELAAIADTLALPESSDEDLGRLRNGAG